MRAVKMILFMMFAPCLIAFAALTLMVIFVNGIFWLT